MKKGVDLALFRVVRTNRRTGEVTTSDRWMRPTHGVKVLRQRHLAKKRAKQARKRQRGKK